jgi:hypothetical protein
VAFNPSSDITDDELRQGALAKQLWHWEDPKSNPTDPWTQRVIEIDDEGLPRLLVECGRLVRLHVRVPPVPGTAGRSPHPRRQRDTMIEFSRALSNTSWLAFDPNHPHERLYTVLDKGAARELKKRFWDDNSAPAYPLAGVARIAGGRHGTPDYPDVAVKVLGVITAVVYIPLREKAGDGISYYIHQMAEVTGKFPFLCVDDQGRLFFAGGNYRSPTVTRGKKTYMPGIED